MPAPGNEWEFLQSVLMRLYNRVVRDDFRDGIPDDTISTPESALRYACLIKDNDTAPMALCRMFLYFLVRGRGLEEPSIPMIWELKRGLTSYGIKVNYLFSGGLYRAPSDILDGRCIFLTQKMELEIIIIFAFLNSLRAM